MVPPTTDLFPVSVTTESLIGTSFMVPIYLVLCWMARLVSGDVRSSAFCCGWRHPLTLGTSLQITSLRSDAPHLVYHLIPGRQKLEILGIASGCITVFVRTFV